MNWQRLNSLRGSCPVLKRARETTRERNMWRVDGCRGQGRNCGMEREGEQIFQNIPTKHHATRPMKVFWLNVWLSVEFSTLQETRVRISFAQRSKFLLQATIPVTYTFLIFQCIYRISIVHLQIQSPVISTAIKHHLKFLQADTPVTVFINFPYHLFNF